MAYYGPETPENVQQALAYLDVALLTGSICELLGSLEEEVKLVWKGPRNASQVCYLLARYTFILSFILFVMSDAPQSSILQNGTFFKQQGLTHWLLNVNLLFVEIIFSLRTWAVWEQARWMGILLAVLMLCLWGSTFGILWALIVTSGGFSYVYFISLSVFYSIIMILTIIKAVQSRNDINTNFVRLVHAQGLTYYTFLFGMSLAALIVVLLGGSNVIVFVARIIQFTFTHLACRMTLSLLAQSHQVVIALDSSDLDFTAEDTNIPLSALEFGRSSARTLRTEEY